MLLLLPLTFFVVAFFWYCSRDECWWQPRVHATTHAFLRYFLFSHLFFTNRGNKMTMKERMNET